MYMGRLADVDSYETDNSQDFEDESGPNRNSLAVYDKDRNREQDLRYPQQERTKRDRYVYISREGAEVDSPGIEEVVNKKMSGNKHFIKS